MTIRETRFDDFEAIGGVLRRNGLSTRTHEQWAYFWRNRPGQAALEGIPRGWVLEDAGGTIVGTFGNIALAYDWNGAPVRAAFASGWAVDESHRAESLGLALAFFRQPGVDLLMTTTGHEATSGAVFEALRAERVPAPSYAERLVWITGHRGFAAGQLRRRGMPAADLVGAIVGAAADAVDAVRSGRPEAASAVEELPRFDARFDALWASLRRGSPRLRAVRDAETLAWRFALEPRAPAILAVDRSGDIAGYLVLVRRDDAAARIRRMEVADLQARGDDPDVVRTLMTAALAVARRDGVHAVTVVGHHEIKRRALAALSPRVRPTTRWPLYYRAVQPALREALRSPDAWDVSPYDGDSLWAGISGERARTAVMDARA